MASAHSPAIAPRNENLGSLQLDVGDTVVLKLNRSLVGVVEETHDNPDAVDSLDNALFIEHSIISSDILQQYIRIGAPPKGYVVVRWWRETYGRSGVAETDLELINRSFSAGDSVKKADGSAGMVIGASTKYILQPIWHLDKGDLLATTLEDSEALGTSADEYPPQPLDFCVPQPPAGIEHCSPHELIYDVPGYELETSGDFLLGDYVVSQDWLGTVEDASLDVVLLLTDGTIVVAKNERELEIIIPKSDGPLVNAPYTYYGRRRDISFSEHRGFLSVAPESLQRGQCVVTNKRNIATGRFITGPCSADTIPRGRVLDVRSRIVSVRWVCPNPFAKEGRGDTPPPPKHKPYENVLKYKSTNTLRPNKKFIRYDHGKTPSSFSPTSNTIEEDFKVGEYVRFKDLTAATNRYCGQSNGHGKLKPVPLDKSYGFDLNEFKILCGEQEVRVLWQDGTKTIERSTSLSGNTLPESDICPTDLVLHKEGLLQIAKSDSSAQAIPYDEMQYIQGNYDLIPQRIGVIQSVDSKERLAQVRWFQAPSIRIINHGLALAAGSCFGPLSDQTEEVSVYEVLTQPGLDRRRGDLAIVAPRNINLAILQSIQDTLEFGGVVGITDFSFWNDFPSYPIFHGLRILAKGLFATWQPTVRSHSPGENDWVGEIVDKGLDGLIKVRLGALQECRDIRIPFEQVLTTISVDSEWDQPISTYGSDAFSPLLIKETIEYEGGKRIDDNSNEGMWLTDGESPAGVEDLANKVDEDLEMLDAFSPLPDLPSRCRSQEAGQDLPIQRAVQLQQSPVTSLVQTSAQPSRFAVLDSSPPPNHFYAREPSTYTPSRLRRIQKEYKILCSSLPPEIFVRTFESRLDLLRVMIIGPQDTPYEFAPLVIDIHLHEDFPAQPPHARFHSWTHGLGRINPNLYEDGKICLSLLGTWPGKSGENWSQESSLLQLLVSLTGLVLVKTPFYNEAGFETLAAEGTYAMESSQYTEKAYIIARGFIKHALRYPVSGLEDVLSWTYLPTSSSYGSLDTTTQSRPNLLEYAISRAKSLIWSANSSESQANSMHLFDGGGMPSKDGFLRKPSKGALVMLRRQIQDLDKILHEWTA